MTRQRTFIKRLLCDLYFFGLSYSLLGPLLYFATGSMAAAFAGGLVLGPVLAMLWLRRSVRSLPLFLFGHLALLALPVVLPVHGVIRLLLFAYQLAAVIYSLVLRLKGEWSLSTAAMVVGCVVAAVAALGAARLGYGEVAPLLAGCAMLEILCNLWQEQLARVDQSLGVVSLTTRQPVESILRFNNGIIAVFLLLVAGVGAAAAGFFPLGAFMRQVGRLLQRLLRWLLSLLPGGQAAPPPAEEAVVDEMPGGMDMLPDEPPREYLWLQVLEIIVRWAFLIALIGAVVGGILYGAYRLYKQFYSTAVDEAGDFKEFVPPDLRLGGLRGALGRLRDRLPAFGTGEREQIRRRYYKKVRRHIRQGAEIRRSDSPGEICSRLASAEDLTELTGLYEQARYSREPENR